MEHFITEIAIDKLLHLSNITIHLNPDHKQHLILTGKNGSGKTSLLTELKDFLWDICQALSPGLAGSNRMYAIFLIVPLITARI